MQCSVPNFASKELKTDSSESSSITFHEFPKDAQTSLQGKQDFGLDREPSTLGLACSNNFSNEGLVKTELSAMETDVDDVSAKLEQRCRICLCSDRKVYNIGENDILQQYELLTASKDIAVDIVPQCICWECKARLASFSRLRCVALRSLRILHEYHESIKKKPDDIQLIIDRDKEISTTLVSSNMEIVDYPPQDKSIVILRKISNNNVISKLENRNDNCKKTKVFNMLRKGRKLAKRVNNNDNLSKALANRRKNIKVKNVNDNSDPNNTNDNLQDLTKVSKVLKRRKRFKVSKKDNFDDKNDYDNFENDIFKYETESEKSDEIKSDLEDIIYDSDNSKSDDDIKNKVDNYLAKISDLFGNKKLSALKRNINMDCERLENGENEIENNLKLDEELEEHFEITKLSNDEMLKEFEQRKESKNYKNARFKCCICFKGFLREETYNSHKITHTSVIGPAKCPICGVHFKIPSNMRSHIRLSHQYKFTCKKCKFSTGRIPAAQLHVKFHKGTVYKCSQCDRIFQKQTSMLSHVRIQHKSDIVCRLCGYSFLNEQGLNFHINKKHKMESSEVPADGPKCIECDIQFSNDVALHIHYQESSKHKILFPETSKNNEIPNKSNRIYINPKKNNPKAVICELCDTELPNFRKYRLHFNESHPGSVRTQFLGSAICEICGLGFSCPSVLEDHKLIHSDVFKYSCEECGQQFKTKQSMNIHKAKHLNKKYTCDVCLNTYSSLSNMQRHRIVHENRKFDCNICGKSFNAPHNRKAHIDYIHHKKPLPVRKDRPKRKRVT